MSFIKRMVNLIWRPLHYVGRDLQGNRFYEHPRISYDTRATRRIVEYKHQEDVWNYIGRGKRLPVQWSMWLSHTRQHPPTLEELQQDLERQRRVLANAAVIEARDFEQSQERLRIEQYLKAENAKRSQPDQPRPLPASDNSAPPHRNGNVSPVLTPNLVQDSSLSKNEPEAWSPQTFQRGV